MAITKASSNAVAAAALGDLVVGSGTNDSGILPIGTTGQVLTVAAGTASWATPAGGGKVLQVLQDTHTGAVSTSSTSFQDTNCTISITPSSVSSKILVIANINGATKQSGNAANAVKLELLRGATQIFATGDIVAWTGASNFATDCTTMVYLDSPSTTSAITYKARFASTVSGQTANINYFNLSDTCMSSIVVMEIGA